MFNLSNLWRTVVAPNVKFIAADTVLSTIAKLEKRYDVNSGALLSRVREALVSKLPTRLQSKYSQIEEVIRTGIPFYLAIEKLFKS
jgi:Holliday junction resolvasome RuvABC endonuclease subunit